MQISVVVPAYNEASRIGKSLEKIVALCERDFSDWEILVVDDGSTDRTAEIARSFEGVRCVRNEHNLGKGSSVRRGVLEASFDPVLFTDCDLSTPIEEALALYRAIENGADLALASRQAGGNKRVQRTPGRRIMAMVFRLAVKAIALRGIHDTQCGFKMFRRMVARQIFPLQQLKGWAFDVELLVIARASGFRIAEVPVAWEEAEESRLSWRSPFEMLRDLFKIRWNRLRGRYRIPCSVAEPKL